MSGELLLLLCTILLVVCTILLGLVIVLVYGLKILDSIAPVENINSIHSVIIFSIKFVLSPSYLSRLLSWRSFGDFLSTKMKIYGEIPKVCEKLCELIILLTKDLNDSNNSTLLQQLFDTDIFDKLPLSTYLDRRDKFETPDGRNHSRALQSCSEVLLHLSKASKFSFSVLKTEGAITHSLSVLQIFSDSRDLSALPLLGNIVRFLTNLLNKSPSVDFTLEKQIWIDKPSLSNLLSLPLRESTSYANSKEKSSSNEEIVCMSSKEKSSSNEEIVCMSILKILSGRSRNVNITRLYCHFLRYLLDACDFCGISIPESLQDNNLFLDLIDILYLECAILPTEKKVRYEEDAQLINILDLLRILYLWPSNDQSEKELETVDADVCRSLKALDVLVEHLVDSVRGIQEVKQLLRNIAGRVLERHPNWTECRSVLSALFLTTSEERSWRHRKESVQATATPVASVVLITSDHESKSQQEVVITPEKLIMDKMEAKVQELQSTLQQKEENIARLELSLRKERTLLAEKDAELERERKNTLEVESNLAAVLVQLETLGAQQQRNAAQANLSAVGRDQLSSGDEKKSSRGAEGTEKSRNRQKNRFSVIAYKNSIPTGNLWQHIVIVRNSASNEYFRICFDDKKHVAMSANRLLLHSKDTKAEDLAITINAKLGILSTVRIEPLHGQLGSIFSLSFSGFEDIELFDRVLEAIGELKMTVAPDYKTFGLKHAVYLSLPWETPLNASIPNNILAAEKADHTAAKPFHIAVIDTGFQSAQPNFTNDGDENEDCDDNLRYHGLYSLRIIVSVVEVQSQLRGLMPNVKYFPLDLTPQSAQRGPKIVLESLNELEFGSNTKLLLINILQNLLFAPSVTNLVIAFGDALKAKANLINMSMNWREKNTIKKWVFFNLVEMFETILLDVRETGCLTVMAAGNEPTDLDELVDAAISPERAKDDLIDGDIFATIVKKNEWSDSIILVASTGASGSLSNFSSFGGSVVSIAAVGENIPVFDPDQLEWRSRTGTSLATPQVTAGLAMMARLFPQVHPSQFVQRLNDSVDLSLSLAGRCRSNGRMNLGRALKTDLVGTFGVLTNLPEGAASLERIRNSLAEAEDKCRSEIALGFEDAMSVSSDFLWDTIISDAVTIIEEQIQVLEAADFTCLSNFDEKRQADEWLKNTLALLRIEVIKLRSTVRRP